MAVPVAAAGAMPFLQALFSTKAGLQAIGMTASAIPKIAALTGADPKKVGKLSQAANFLNLGLQIGGAGIDIGKAFKNPETGTPTGEDLGKAGESFSDALAIGDITGGVLGKQNLAMLTDKPFGVAGDMAGINPNWSGEGLKINDPNYNSITESFTKDYWK